MYNSIKPFLKDGWGEEESGGRKPAFTHVLEKKELTLNIATGRKAGGKKGVKKFIFEKFTFAFYLFDTY